MKSSPIYNKLQHYLIEHACMYINISYINMCRLKFTVHKNKCNAIIVKPNILLPQPYVTLVKFGYPVKALWFDGSQ